MTLLQQWRNTAYSETANKGDLQRLWTTYFEQEKDIYAQLLANPSEEVKGTVKELADKYGMTVLSMVGFLDGINDSLKEQNPLETLEADSQVKIDIDLEKLYYNMVAAKADWLYELPQWDKLLSVEKRQELYKAQKRSMIVVKGKKIGRNEPCPCGSGKKYKQCCGR